MIDITHHFHGAFLVLFLIGLYIMVDDPNLLKKVIGLNLMQISVFLLLITIAYPEGGAPPLLDLAGPYPNPLAHVLVLTAIVVGVALTALALALIVRLYAEFGTVHAREIEAAMAADGEESGAVGSADAATGSATTAEPAGGEHSTADADHGASEDDR